MPLHASLTLLVTHMQLRHPCSILLVVLDPPNSSQLVHQVLLNFFSSRQLSSHLVRQMLLNSSTNFFSTSSHLGNCLLISSAKCFSTRPPTSSQLLLISPTVFFSSRPPNSSQLVHQLLHNSSYEAVVQLPLEPVVVMLLEE